MELSYFHLPKDFTYNTTISTKSTIKSKFSTVNSLIDVSTQSYPVEQNMNLVASFDMKLFGNSKNEWIGYDLELYLKSSSLNSPQKVKKSLKEHTNSLLIFSHF